MSAELKSSSWERLREDFPVTKKFSYLANAAISPIPRQVQNAVARFYKDNMIYGGTRWQKWIDLIEEARRMYADFIGARSEEIAFTHSTSEGMNIIAHMLAHRGHAISNDLEFPSSNLPWINRGADMTIVPSLNGMVPIERIRKAIRRRTRTIITSHVQYSTGFKQDLETLSKICGEENLYLVVNATQSIGALNFDVDKFGVGFTVANGHKWLLSSFGIGTLYVQSKLLDDESGLNPPFFSQFGQEDREHFDNMKIRMSKNASKFELSTPHFPNIIALKAAIAYISKINILRIEERIRYLTQYLIDRLAELKIQILSPLSNIHRSAIIVFKSRSPEHLVAYLGKKRIIVSARGGGIRVSPHFYNDESDIDKLISALKTYQA
ncbi:MAG: aminotransferase class V-fold PLP-dependent enzyme [Nitrososphaeraceae archaeon]|nr:aminotransferase class V-fold PLP-dependent enzyme [Nitrososphaeraceae archaeon]